MPKVKFSQFSTKTSLTDSDYTVGYNGSTNYKWTLLNLYNYIKSKVDALYATINHTHSNYVPYATGSYTIPADTGRWVRIAASPVGIGRVYGRFLLEYSVIGYHGMVEFEVANHYNKADSIKIVKIYNSIYNYIGVSGVGIQDARIVYKLNTYSNEYCYVEVYVYNANTTETLTLFIKGMHLNNLTISISDGSIPTGYTSKELYLANATPFYSTDDHYVALTQSGAGVTTWDCRYIGKNAYVPITQAPKIEVKNISEGYEGYLVLNQDALTGNYTFQNCTDDDGNTIDVLYDGSRDVSGEGYRVITFKCVRYAPAGKYMVAKVSNLM